MKEIIVMGLKNIVGGVENFLLAMQHELQDKMRFLCIFESAENIHEKEVFAQGGESIYVPRENGFAEYSRSIRKVLTDYRSRCDTVYLNISDYSHEHLYVLMVSKRLKYKVAIHSHAAQLVNIASPFNRLTHSLFRTMSQAYARNCTRLAVSQRAGCFMYGRQTFQIISPGIDLKRFSFNSSIRIEVRKRYACGNRFVIGFVGRLAKVKNPEFALRILKELENALGPDKVLMMMVGDGPLMDELQKLSRQLKTEQEVLFIGTTNDVPMYMQAMDCMVGTSFSEGMPISFIEAQAMALPCFCAEENYPKEIGITNFLHMIPLSAGESAWADEIIQIMEEPCREDKRKTFDSIKELASFDWHQSAEKLYARLCDDAENIK